MLHRTKTFVIFWLPAGFHFEAPGHGSDRRFESLTLRFMADVGGTPNYDIVTQYSDDLGPIQNVSRLGGSAVDSHPYPADTSAFGAEVVSVAAKHGWPGGLTSLFIVITAAGVFSGFDFHSATDSRGVNFVFAAVTDPFVCSACGPDGVDPAGVASPNKDTTFDLATRSLSHEMFEAITNPLGVSWYDPAGGLGGGEIGDKCVGQLQDAGPDGADVTLHGHRYFVVSLWSNAQHSCTLSFGPPQPPRDPRGPLAPSRFHGKHARLP